MVEVRRSEVDASALLITGLVLFSIFGFPWLHYIPPLADITMRIKACTLSVLLISGLGLFSIFGFPWLHYIPPLADVIMRIKAYTLL
jgi:hypothetical protein